MNGAELVVDASLALKWVVEEPYSAEAKALLEHWRSHRKRLIAPALFLYEVTNVIAKRIQRGQLTLEQGREKLQFFLEAGPTLRQLGNLHLRALALMKQFRMTAAYDAHYLALAEWRRCECWTADERLWNTVKSELAWVRWIGAN